MVRSALSKVNRTLDSNRTNWQLARGSLLFLAVMPGRLTLVIFHMFRSDRKRHLCWANNLMLADQDWGTLFPLLFRSILSEANPPTVWGSKKLTIHSASRYVLHTAQFSSVWGKPNPGAADKQSDWRACMKAHYIYLLLVRSSLSKVNHTLDS